MPTPHDQTPNETGAIPTRIAPAVAWFMIASFVALIAGLPLAQLGTDLSRDQRPQLFALFDRVPDKANLRAWEDDLEKASLPRAKVQPALQGLLSGVGGFGNTNVIIGRDGWLFYRPGLEYLAGPGVLDPARLRQRRRQMIDSGERSPHPDPREAILAFHRRCAAAGARLVLMPVPDKVMLQPSRLSARPAPATPPNNREFGRLLDELRAAGLDVFDCTPGSPATGEDRFLIQDTHWTPQWMEQVAGELAAHLKPHLGPAPALALKAEAAEAARVGDLVDMLKLPEGQRLFSPQAVKLRRVVEAGRDWQPSHQADVLFLGDSFANIYSSEIMGWGSSAGLVEHLGLALRRPIDCIVRNDAGASATRKMLGAQLAAGKDRLAGKKVVVWEFAVRELAVGNWPPIEMKVGETPPSRFLVPSPGVERVITGTVESAGVPPRPGTVPYKDHIIAVHLTDLEDDNGPIVGGQALVYVWSMRGNVLTPAAHFRPDQRIRLKLRPWADVSAKLDAINRRELDNDEINLQEPFWGEEVRP
jgi:hypothetical protein